MKTPRALREKVPASRGLATGLAACLLALPFLARPADADGDRDRLFQLMRRRLQGRQHQDGQAQEEDRAAGAAQKFLERAREKRQAESLQLVGRLRQCLASAQESLEAANPARAQRQAQRALTGAQYVEDELEAERLRSRAQAILDQAGKHATAKPASTRPAPPPVDGQRAAHTLCQRGWDFYEDGDYQKALQMAEQALERRPGSKEAIFLRRQARQATAPAEADPERRRAERRKLHDDILVRQMEEEMTPPEDIKAKVVLPGETPSAEQATRALDRSMPPWEQRLRAKLREHVTVAFEDATLQDACDHLAKLADVPILVDPAVADCPRRIDLPEMTVSFDHVLRWVGRFCDVKHSLRDHAILISRRGGLLDEPVTREYDVSGLLLPTRTVTKAFPGATQFDTAEVRKKLFPETAAGEKGRPSKETIGEGWTEFIRNTVAPETWADAKVMQEEQRYTIRYRNGRIVVVHTPDVQRQIAELLDNFRRARTLQVHILARFIELNTDFLEDIGINFEHPLDLRPDGPARFGFESIGKRSWDLVGDVINDSQVGTIQDGISGDPVLSLSYSYLGGDEVHALLTAVLKRRKGTLLIAPRLTCFNTQRANFQAVTNFNYVRSISSDNEPEIGNVPEGVIFDVQPFVGADRRSITLVLQPQLRSLVGGQIPRFAYVRPLGSEGIDPDSQLVGIVRWVQVPTVELKSLATTVTVPDGGTLLLGGLSRATERRGFASVPFAVGLPVLQYLFRDWREVERRTSLIILVTADIVPDIFQE
ncbi:MAG: hypothetical protein ACOC8A_00945 [bacterium]